MDIGIQISSLKPLLTTRDQVRTAFAQMHTLGCRTVQLQWIDSSVEIPFIADCLRQNQIRSVSVQDFYETVSADLDYYTGLNAATGGTWLCVSRIPERLKSAAGLDTFVQELQALQKKLDFLGQKVCFHPVTADFTAVAGMDAIAYLLEAMPELVICLDLYHLNRNCENMPEFIRQYGPRICMVHFKDSRNGCLVPAGQGDTRWEGVVTACLEAGVPYAFAEQETWDRDPYDCLLEAMDWIRSQSAN